MLLSTDADVIIFTAHLNTFTLVQYPLHILHTQMFMYPISLSVCIPMCTCSMNVHTYPTTTSKCISYHNIHASCNHIHLLYYLEFRGLPWLIHMYLLPMLTFAFITHIHSPCSHPIFVAFGVGVHVHEWGGGDLIREAPHTLPRSQLIYWFAPSRDFG